MKPLLGASAQLWAAGRQDGWRRARVREGDAGLLVKPRESERQTWQNALLRECHTLVLDVCMGFCHALPLAHDASVLTVAADRLPVVLGEGPSLRIRMVAHCAVCRPISSLVGVALIYTPSRPTHSNPPFGSFHTVALHAFLFVYYFVSIPSFVTDSIEDLTTAVSRHSSTL